MIDLKAIREVAEQECRCKGNIIPGGPCRHGIAQDMLKLVDALVDALIDAEDEVEGTSAAAHVDAALTFAGYPDSDSRARRWLVRGVLPAKHPELTFRCAPGEPIKLARSVHRPGPRSRGAVRLEDGTLREETDEEFSAHLRELLERGQ